MDKFDETRLEIAYTRGWKWYCYALGESDKPIDWLLYDKFDGSNDVWIEKAPGESVLSQIDKTYDIEGVPDWPHDIAAAMALLDEIRADGWYITIKLYPPDSHGIERVAVIAENDSDPIMAPWQETLPMAICDAWLQWHDARGKTSDEV